MSNTGKLAWVPMVEKIARILIDHMFGCLLHYSSVCDHGGHQLAEHCRNGETAGGDAADALPVH